MTKFLNISTDNTLGGSSASDVLVSSQKAVKDYVDQHGGGGGLPDQTGHAGEFLTTDGTDASWSDAIGYHPDLFDWKWADHICNDVQWLRADTFSWQSGAVYEAAFIHIWNDIFVRTHWTDGGTFVYTKNRFPFIGEPVYSDSSLTTQIGTVSAYDGQITVNGTQYHYNYALPETQQTETIAGVTITYYPADDGHKIVLASQESNVTAIYNATGVAWYYVLDTTNQRFKLPRINPDVAKQGFGMIPVKGNGYALGLTGKSGGNTYDAILGGASVSGTGGFTGTLQTANGYNIGQSNSVRSLSGNIGISTDVTKSGIVADVDAQTTIFSGKKYLYFYVGNFTQTALENTAGLNAELFNGKADINLTNAVSNASSVAKETIVGWCIPDYSAGVSKLPNTDYTAEFSGRLICCTTSAYGGGGVDYITVDSQVVSTSTNSYEGYRGSLIADIAKGSSFRITKNSGETGWAYTFYPMKGV